MFGGGLLTNTERLKFLLVKKGRRNCFEGLVGMSMYWISYVVTIGLQISRNTETGVSKGCGYVTMGTVNAAKVAIAALDGSVSVKLVILFV